MRQAESAYWDDVADSVESGEGFLDNWLKRRIIGQLLLKADWMQQTVLEIGVGCGATAALLALSCGNMWSYTGTDVSEKFGGLAKKNFGLNVVKADVLSLPEGKFSRILALDSLEHVRPEDREEGYKAIVSRMAPGALLFINMPISRSIHEAEFDHGIDLGDLKRLEANGLTLTKYDRYDIRYGNYVRAYGFVVMTK